MSRQGGAERAVVMGNTGLECQAQEPGFSSCAVEQKRNIAEWCGGQGGGVFPGSQGKRMRTEESSSPSSICEWSSIHAGTHSTDCMMGVLGSGKEALWAESWQHCRAQPHTATEGAPCGSPSHGLPCPLSALCAPHCPCPPRPLPGVASALHVSLLSAWPPSHTAAGVCLCGPPTPSPLSLLPFQTVRPPISWFPTRLPSQGSLRSPRHEAVRWRGHVAECQLSSAVICVGSAMVSISEPPVSPAPGRHRRAFQP